MAATAAKKQMKQIRKVFAIAVAVLLMAGFAGCMDAGSYANENPMTVRNTVHWNRGW